MRGFAQKKEYDCSPVAIVNAILWARRKKTTQREREALYKLVYDKCRTDETGTSDEWFRKSLSAAANAWGFTAQKVKTLTYDEILYHLFYGGAIILTHQIPWDSEDEDWHHSFWHKVDGEWFHGYNVIDGSPDFVCKDDAIVDLLDYRTIGEEETEIEFFLLKKL